MENPGSPAVKVRYKLMWHLFLCALSFPHWRRCNLFSWFCPSLPQIINGLPHKMYLLQYKVRCKWLDIQYHLGWIETGNSVQSWLQLTSYSIRINLLLVGEKLSGPTYFRLLTQGTNTCTHTYQVRAFMHHSLHLALVNPGPMLWPSAPLSRGHLCTILIPKKRTWIVHHGVQFLEVVHFVSHGAQIPFFSYPVPHKCLSGGTHTHNVKTITPKAPLRQDVINVGTPFWNMIFFMFDVKSKKRQWRMCTQREGLFLSENRQSHFMWKPALLFWYIHVQYQKEPTQTVLLR